VGQGEPGDSCYMLYHFVTLENPTYIPTDNSVHPVIILDSVKNISSLYFNMSVSFGSYAKFEHKFYVDSFFVQNICHSVSMARYPNVISFKAQQLSTVKTCQNKFTTV
jgi:hypothetical protein